MSAADFKIFLGEALKEFRIAEDITQEHLAEIAGFDRNYVGSAERGERNISMANLYKLAKALRIKASEIVVRAEQLEAQNR